MPNLNNESMDEGARSLTQKLTIQVTEAQAVSALLQVPQHATACYVIAHGAGAGMGNIGGAGQRFPE
jgi:hypothetical protein